MRRGHIDGLGARATVSALSLLLAACGGPDGAPPRAMPDAAREETATLPDASEAMAPDTGPHDAGPADVDHGLRASEAASSIATNPYGVPYPTDDFGTSARSGSVPGDRISNLKFLGYATPEQGTLTPSTGPLTAISLADFYDPLNKKYKVLRINLNEEWCTPSNLEATEFVAAADKLAKEGIVILEALREGYESGTPAVPADLRSWIANRSINYDTVLDPESYQLGPFMAELEVPWGADIDVRTMEILDKETGYDGDTVATVEAQLKWVETHAPSYP